MDALRKSFPQGAERSLIIPALWLVQEQCGYVPDEAVPYLAQLLPVPEIMVREAVTWYSMFRNKKVGKYHLQVCHNLSCSLRGADGLLAHLKARLGIAPGEITADGKFSLGTVECLASCGTAPVMQVNDRYYENLTKEKVDQILADLK